MADKHFRKATQEELIDLLVTKYEVREGRVYQIETGREVTPYTGNKEGHKYIRVYGNGVKKSLAVHRAIWMIMTGEPIPEGWEIHHRDENNKNNLFDNLICLHPFDHRKMHGTYKEEVPF